MLNAAHVATLGVAVLAATGPAHPNRTAVASRVVRSATDPGVRTGYLPVHGLRMYYEIHGTGSPLVMIHGTSATFASSFRAVVPLLARDHEVIGLEMQAHGHTGDIDRPLTFEAMADDVAEALRQLHVARADIVGWSMGGNVALQIAIRHPDRVRKLVLSGTTVALDGMQPQVIEAIRNATAATVPAEFRAEYERTAPHPEAWPEHIAKIRELWLGWKGFSADAIRGIRAPALIMAGDADAVRPEHTVELFHLLQGRAAGPRFAPGGPAGGSPAELAILPGTSHATFQDRPAWVAQMIEAFLGRAPSEAFGR